MRPVRFQFRLTHKVAAIGCVGRDRPAAVGVIYQYGTWSQDSARKVAEDARANLGRNERSMRMVWPTPAFAVASSTAPVADTDATTSERAC